MSLDDISIVPEPSADRLNQRQQIDYREQREECLRWLLAFGKDPEKADGYAMGTVKSRAHRMDHFYRWVWNEEDAYTTEVTQRQADEWKQELARADYSDAHRACCQKSFILWSNGEPPNVAARSVNPRFGSRRAVTRLRRATT